MPNQTKGASPYDDAALKQESPEKKSPVKAKAQSPAQEKTQSTGWFGGIFSKLALKPKNQMKLPDDKNPKIVWDQDKKKWINVDEDPNDPSTDFKPPPKLADLMPKSAPGTVPMYNQVPQRNLPAYDVGQVPDRPSSTSGGESIRNASEDAIKSNQPNMFKMQRGRNLKNSYVDVFNPGGKPGSSGAASLPPAVEQVRTGAPQMNFFIPQPVTDPNAPVDFLTPGGVPQLVDQQKRKTNIS
ncbi:hypothetical protein NQ315_016839 [Exocentrus adspersus]|uniref:Uncharacterized protein n=1 Tax=Exocentrus adspersus TaxID=1586481 RepID=A0AAV8VYF4_9CUCU|nr:hypothetical protein NQ315_016839 [Exocentrus adspersus]